MNNITAAIEILKNEMENGSEQIITELTKEILSQFEVEEQLEAIEDVYNAYIACESFMASIKTKLEREDIVHHNLYYYIFGKKEQSYDVEMDAIRQSMERR